MLDFFLICIIFTESFHIWIQKLKYSFAALKNNFFSDIPKKFFEGSICDMLLKCSKDCSQNPWRTTVHNHKIPAQQFIALQKALSSIAIFYEFLFYTAIHFFYKQPICKQAVLTR